MFIIAKVYRVNQVQLSFIKRISEGLTLDHRTAGDTGVDPLVVCEQFPILSLSSMSVSHAAAAITVACLNITAVWQFFDLRTYAILLATNVCHIGPSST